MYKPFQIIGHIYLRNSWPPELFLATQIRMTTFQRVMKEVLYDVLCIAS